jgi:integrase/recombinase XerD
MFLSKGYNGNYYLYYEDFSTGKRRKLSTGTKLKSEATRFMFTFDKKRKVVHKPKPTPLITLSSIKEEVVQYAQTNFSDKTKAMYEFAIKKMLLILGDKPIKLLSFRDFEYYKTERLKTVCRTTVNIELRVMKAIFNYVIKLGYMQANPVVGVKQFSIPQKEKLSFSPQELQQLLTAIDNTVIKNIVMFALFTGCRITEILNVQYKNIDLNHRCIDIVNKPDFKTKTGKVRRIPISEQLYDLLVSNLEIDNITLKPEKYLFPSSRTEKYDKDFISKKFKRYIRKAGLSDKFHFHCLRHTFITYLIKSGVNLNYVKELAGHTNINTTMGYIHIETEDLREAVNMIKID